MEYDNDSIVGRMMTGSRGIHPRQNANDAAAERRSTAPQARRALPRGVVPPAEVVPPPDDEPAVWHATPAQPARGGGRRSPAASRRSSTYRSRFPDARVVETGYRRTRAAAGLGAFWLLWVALWVGNGLFTAMNVMVFLNTTWGVGLALHIVITVIEVSVVFLTPYLRGMPWLVTITVWLIALSSLAIDVGSSTLGLLYWAWVWFDVLPSPLTIVIATIVSGGIAMGSEPMIIWLTFALMRVINERGGD